MLPRRQRPRLQPPRLHQLLLFSVAAMCTLMHAAQAARPQQTTLIVQYKPEVLRSVTTASMSSTAAATAAAAANAAAAASAAAEGWGASSEKQASIAAVASAAAAAIPAVASVTSAVTEAASRSGIRVVSQANYATVLQGAAIKTASAADARRLRQQLERDPSVQQVWLAGTRKLVQPVEGDAAAVAAAAAAAAARSRPAAGRVRRSASFRPGSSSLLGSLQPAATALTGNLVTTGLARLLNQSPQLNGTGALICIVDTGINYKLDVFGSCTGLNAPAGQCRVVTGYNLVGDAYNGTSSGAAPVRGGEPVDCMGHGTMVASVAATSNGVAPGALLGSYRVFGCEGYVTDDVLIEAIDRAVRDGCDIINLSLSSGSGYAENSVFKPVMQAALDKGVLVVKAAGNAGRDGPFNADVATAAGAIAAGSVGNGLGDPIDQRLAASGFSSYGPSATLDLVPHVSAPGAFITVKTQEGKSNRVSGTSFASPYIAGSLALWLQAKRGSAAASGQLLGAGSTNQDAALRGLVASVRGVPDADNRAFLEPLPKTGAGVIQVDALMANQLQLSPMMVQLPSALTKPFSTNISLSWSGPPHPAGSVVYQLKHTPAASMTVSNGWYGTEAAIKKVYAAALVTFTPQVVTINTSSSEAVTVQVNVTLPAGLSSQPLLYSGLIRLLPATPPAFDSMSSNSSESTLESSETSNSIIISTNTSAVTSALNGSTNTSSLSNSTNDASEQLQQQHQRQRHRLEPSQAAGLPAVSLPYQGFSQDWSQVRIPAAVNFSLNAWLAETLQAKQNSLCYAPRSQPVFVNSIMDSMADVPGVCSGGFASGDSAAPLNVSLAVLRASPECSLRVTLVPEVPMRMLYLHLLDGSSNLLGSLEPLDPSSGSSLASQGEVWSVCSHFSGAYKDTLGRQRLLEVGGTYKLRALLQGPVSAADQDLGQRPENNRVDIGGAFTVVP